MAILERKCRASRDTLVRERQDMVAMSMKAVMVILPTNMDTLTRPLATLATTASHSQHPMETTLPTIACLVMQVRSMLGCPLDQEHHSQATLLDHLVHRVSRGLQADRKEGPKDQNSLMPRVDHTCQYLLMVIRSKSMNS